MGHSDYIAVCNASLIDKPFLQAVFNNDWQAQFRIHSLTATHESDFGYPLAYWWPMLELQFPGGIFPPNFQSRIESGLDILFSQMTKRDRTTVTVRLQTGNPSVCDELLAASAFASEFGRKAVNAPHTAPDKQKPEFFVDVQPARWALECKLLHDNADVQARNQQMIQTGRPWIKSHVPNHGATRLRRALIQKIQSAQGGGPTFVILTSYAPWLMPDEMQRITRQILCEPTSLGLVESDLPIGIACLFWTVLQGIWFCERACAAALIDGQLRERIRLAIVRGFVPRNDVALLTEADW